jgi:DNA-binding transcriptional MerR regulator
MDHTVGDLAKRSGLTVRTLHHYEELGLLVPSARTDSGYRLYTDADVHTLHRILAYRHMGLPLKDIGPLLAPGAQAPLADLLARQITVVEARIAEQQRLLSLLQRVARRARAGDNVDVEELLRLITAQRVIEQHYSDDEIARMRAMQDAIPPDTLRHLKAEMPQLLAGFRAAHDAGTPPGDGQVLELSRRWLAMERLVPIDEDLRLKGRRMLASDAGFQQVSGIDAALARYIDAALDAAKADDAAKAAPGSRA